MKITNAPKPAPTTTSTTEAAQPADASPTPVSTSEIAPQEDGVDAADTNRLTAFVDERDVDEEQREVNTPAGPAFAARAQERVGDHVLLAEKAPELAALFADQPLSKLSEIFGGASVEEICDLPQVERNTIAFDALLYDPELEPTKRQLSIRVKTDAFLRRVGRAIKKYVDRAEEGYSGKIDDDKAKNIYTGTLLEVYGDLKKKAGRKKVTCKALVKVYDEKVRATAKDVAGQGLDSHWISLKEARQLPPDMRQLYQTVRGSLLYSDRYDRAFLDPFPDGFTDSELLSRNYFVMLNARTIADMAERYEAFARVDALAQAVEGGKVKLDDGTTIEMIKDSTVDGQSLYTGGLEPPCMLFRRPQGTLMLAKVGDGFGGKQLEIATFKKSGDRWSFDVDTTYLARSSREVMHDKYKDRLADLGKPPSRAEALLGRVNRTFSQPSVVAELVALAARHAGAKSDADDVMMLSGLLDAKETTVIAEYFHRADAVDIFKEIALMVPKFDEVDLGDSDLQIEIQKEFKTEVSVFDDDTGDETITEKIYLKDKGPLLTFENAASGLDWAVELDALKEGRLVIHSFYDNETLQTIELDKSGKPASEFDMAPYSSIAFSMIWSRDELTQMVAEQGSTSS